MSSTGGLPIFPLNHGLVPLAMVPLAVFEPRYVTMMADIADDGRFGVVLIERGSEVGGGDHRFTVGTAAEIILRRDSPGELFVVARGTGRIRVEEWLGDDPYPRAAVTELTDEPLVCFEDAAELVRVARRAMGLAAEIGFDTGSGVVEFSVDPVQATYQVMSVVPLPSLDRQRLLEIDSSAQRLAATMDSVRDFNDLVEAQLSGR